MKRLLIIFTILFVSLSLLLAKSFVDDGMGLLSKDEKAKLEDYYQQIKEKTGYSVGVHTFIGSDDEEANDAYTNEYSDTAFSDVFDYVMLYYFPEGEENYFLIHYDGALLNSFYEEDVFKFLFDNLQAAGEDTSYYAKFEAFGESVEYLAENIEEVFDTPVLEEDYIASYIKDEVGLLSEAEIQKLDHNLLRYSIDVGYPILVATVDSVKGLNTIDDSDLLLEDYVGINQDGVMLYINMGNREWNITTSGRAIHELNDRTLERLENIFLPYLKDGNYYEAFDRFASNASIYALAERGRNSDEDFQEEGIDWSFYIFVGLGLGIIIAAITTSNMKKKLKTAVMVDNANDFVKKDSFHLTQQSDIFLYRNVSKVKIEKSSSSSSVHHSSSGGSHGGRSGRF